MIFRELKIKLKYVLFSFVNIFLGADIIKDIYHKLYKNKLKEFDLGYEYVPHMTVGKLKSKELLDKALNDVS